jgi:hypothetical protein
VVYFAYQLGIFVIGKQLVPQDYNLRLDGGPLPVTIVGRNATVIAWRPGDYVVPGCAVAKAPLAWTAIVENPDHAATFAYFEKAAARKRELTIKIFLEADWKKYSGAFRWEGVTNRRLRRITISAITAVGAVTHGHHAPLRAVIFWMTKWYVSNRNHL